MKTQEVTGKLVQVREKRIIPARIGIENGVIKHITPLPEETSQENWPFITPGFIDAHVHIESSMLIPSEFARLAVVHGTVATISDPHEIANVCGMEGVEFMINNGQQVPFHFYFGAPSCVPATSFETAGASLGVPEIESLLQRQEIRYLSEMMNFPGVLHRDPEVTGKLDAAVKAGKVIDGHAPGLKGHDAFLYSRGGIPENDVVIHTDHECFTLEEALDKLKCGMKIIIREGSAARNFEALIPLLKDYPDRIMFGSDDKHPDSLVNDHINSLCARAIAKGHDVFDVLQASCINPIDHYGLSCGSLREGDPADFILLKDLTSFAVIQTYINGRIVASEGKTMLESVPVNTINQFNCSIKNISDFVYPSPLSDTIPVIRALDGQLITIKEEVPIENFIRASGIPEPNVEKDLLKLVVVNRYQDKPIAVSFISGFGLKQGALASSVAHDSHNIVAVGVDDESICMAVNEVIKHQGAISIAGPNGVHSLPLPVAGLMSESDGYRVAAQYEKMDLASKTMGSTLRAPYMTLSFMALLVIPHLKLSDLGLFDGDQFQFVFSGS